MTEQDAALLREADTWQEFDGGPIGQLIVDLAAALRRACERADAETARMDWLIDNGTSHGGGNGFTFTVFVPHDTEDLRTGIEVARSRP